MLTSEAAEALRTVETVIVDEIHALVPTKRGAHLALSLERLEALVTPAAAGLQRIGLSATQRPLEEVARFLGGADARQQVSESAVEPASQPAIAVAAMLDSTSAAQRHEVSERRTTRCAIGR